MPCYGNPSEVWFTVQSLRMYQDISDCEILVIDNQGSEEMQKLVNSFQDIKYFEYPDINGTGPVRNKIFEVAKGDFVLVIDSHVLLWPNSILRLKWWLKEHWDDAKNLIHGPMVLSSLKNFYSHYLPVWRGQMWGIWPDGQTEEQLPRLPFEIQMMGCGLFGCRKDSWLGFHSKCRGFGGVEGVIHEKYRKAGRKVLCLPWLKWCHYFGSPHKYPLHIEDRIRNFLLGFKELNLDPAPIYEHFGKNKVAQIAKNLGRETLAKTEC